MVSERAVVTLFIMIGATAMIIARRWNNPSDDAGYGIAGWGMAVVVLMWI